MPWTGVFFFVGALSISAIPPLNGFVSEWLIFQSLLLSFNFPEMAVKILIPVTIGMLALTGALAAACFVRAYGIAFLAAPRSEHAAEAEDVPLTMLAGMAILAILCVLTGLMSAFIVPAIDAITSPVIGVSVASKMTYGIVMKPVVASFSSMSPLTIGALLIVILPVIYIITRYYGGRKKIVTGDTWDCGTPLSPRNEYTGTAYAKSINMIFSAIYRPSKELVARPTASPYIRKEMTYEDRTEPVFEKYLYNPVAGFIVKAARRLSFIQTGSIQAYLTYIFITLVLLLIIFR
jgi:hydrogenase-4 component B